MDAQMASAVRVARCEAAVMVAMAVLAVLHGAVREPAASFVPALPVLEACSALPVRGHGMVMQRNAPSLLGLDRYQSQRKPNLVGLGEVRSCRLHHGQTWMDQIRLVVASAALHKQVCQVHLKAPPAKQC
mmetsp:Transcript_62256/g.181877  ORF Transcript_62256/g.181877 Transcript_62256/m.181877 type:complete len:130 (+) Transcript_62256:688-1077(+)